MAQYKSTSGFLCFISSVVLLLLVASESHAEAPYVYQVLPPYGPSSGGSKVRFLGYFGESPTVDQTQVLIGVEPCNLACESCELTNDTIICKTPVLGTQIMNTDLDITVLISGVEVPLLIQEGSTFVSRGTVYTSQYKYQYRNVPRIDDISPKSTIINGGIPLTITGKHLDSVFYPRLLIHVRSNYNWINTTFTQVCHFDNSTILICDTPAINTTDLPGYDATESGILNVHSKESYILGFDFDGYTEYIISNLDLGLGNGSIQMYNPPEVDMFDETYVHKTYGNNRKPVSINGNNFQVIASQSDYRLTLQIASNITEDCPITSFQNNRIQCDLPDVEVTDLAVLVFHVGTIYTREIGHIRYETSILKNDTFVVVLVVCCVVVCVVVVGVVFFWRRRRQRNRKEREWQEREKGRISMEQIGAPQEQNLYDVLLPHMQVQIKEHLVDSDHVEIDQNSQLGAGFFGVVYKGTFNGNPVAIKVMKNFEADASAVDEFLQEGFLMATFQHQNILSLLGIMIRGRNPHIIVPLMENGDLKTFVSDKNKDLGYDDLMRLVTQCCSGMVHMEEKKFVHRDLAARNCLIDKNMVLKICDFGYTRDVYEKSYYRIQNKKRVIPIRWMAPESLQKYVHTSKSDVWSFGVLIWEVFSRGSKPYADIDNRDIQRYIEAGQRLDKPRDVPEKLYDLMKICWNSDPEDRPDFKDLKEYLLTNDDNDGYLTPIS